MRDHDRARLFLIVGWVLVFFGMFLPTVFIVEAPRFLWFIVPLSCAIVAFGLVLVAGRWPRGLSE